MAEGGGAEKPNPATESKKSDSEFKDFLNLNVGSSKDEKGPKALETLDLDGVVKYIKSGRCTNVITMAGAGISTSAGIPDFRSPGSGLYNNLAAYNLPHPNSIFEISYFKENPKPFFILAKSLLPDKLTPTPCHYFLRLLHEKGLLLRHYTQNVDTLERQAGLPSDKIVEAHGSFNTGHCLKCKAEYTLEWMKERVLKDSIPCCIKSGCAGYVKPDIIFFGEDLPRRFFEMISKDFKKCDLLIILGTSLVVQPFASIIHKVRNETPRLYINLENSAKDDFSSLFGLASEFKYGKNDNYRDVFWKDTCDNGCTLMAKSLGWEEELKSLIDVGNRKEDKTE